MRLALHIISIPGGVAMGLLTAARIRSTAAQIKTPMTGQQGFVGSWFVTYIETEGSPTRALFTLGADGTMVTSEHPVVTPPGASGVIFTSSGHGVWNLIGLDSANFAFVGLGSDLHGNLFAVVTFRGNITLGDDGQMLSGELVATIDDPSGNTLATFPMTLDGTRIVAETSANTT